MLTPRKHPSQQRSRATVDAILEAAARILEGAGLDALTTNAVAERAGVSIGSLYQYFPSKQAILLELLHRHRSAFVVQLEQALATSANASLEAVVRKLVVIAVDQQLARPDLTRVLDFVEPTLPMSDADAADVDAIGKRIATLFAAHGIKAPARAAIDVMAMSRSLIDAAGQRGECDRRALVTRVTRSVLGYLDR
jgi:AcrR family transcriptional regulator